MNGQNVERQSGCTEEGPRVLVNSQVKVLVKTRPGISHPK